MSMLPLFNGYLAPVEKRLVNGEWQIIKRTDETITVIARIPPHPWDERFANDIVTSINASPSIPNIGGDSSRSFGATSTGSAIDHRP